MKGSATRTRLVAAAALARSLQLAPSRGERFRDKVRAQPLPLSELSAWPEWPQRAAPEQARIFSVTALRASDGALRDEIDGEALRDYAARVGETVFEDLLARAGEGTAPLPSADTMLAAGRAHAHRALPPILAQRLGIVVAHDPAAMRHVADAEALVRRAPLPRSAA